MGLSLEDFESRQSPALAVEPAESVTRPQAEAEKVASYEQGYQAGWDDATRAEAEDQSRITADFARNLQDISFTFHEARGHVIQSMEPLLNEMVSTLLPNLVKETMGLRIIEELQPLIEAGADSPIELVVSPANLTALETQLEHSQISSIVLVQEPSLGSGQAYLRVGKAELQIDMAQALEKISATIGSFYEINERVLKHG